MGVGQVGFPLDGQNTQSWITSEVYNVDSTCSIVVIKHWDCGDETHVLLNIIMTLAWHKIMQEASWQVEGISEDIIAQDYLVGGYATTDAWIDTGGI